MHHSDPLLGGHAQAFVNVASVNLTVATKARAEVILRSKALESAQIMSWQELRLGTAKPPWLISLAREYGWGIACSDPPPKCNGQSAAIRQGGTAILWRRTVGKIHVVRAPSQLHTHRAIAIKTQQAAFVAVYGPAQGSYDWFVKALSWSQSLHSEALVFGDLNWRPTYFKALTAGWTVAPSIKPTTTVGTHPTKCLLWSEGSSNLFFERSATTRQIDTVFLPGIPYHGLSSYSAQILVTERQQLRMQHTASYVHAKVCFATESEIEEVLEATNRARPLLPRAAAPSDHWKQWHQRAEYALLQAVDKQWASIDRKAERPKGSEPKQRPTCLPPAQRLSETVALRRLLRLHRKYTEQLYHKHKETENLSVTHFASFANAVSDGILEPTDGIPSYSRAVDLVSKAIIQEQRKITAEKSKHWRSVFQRWSQDIYAVASPKFRAQGPASGFDAHAMRDEWEQVWAPEHYSSDEVAANFRSWAEKVKWNVSEKDASWIPSYEEFLVAVQKTHGAAGFDGWGSRELHLIKEILPFIIQELYDLWVLTTSYLVKTRQLRADPERMELLRCLFSWRVTGIPKKGENESRPIGVARVPVRAWLSALACALPTVDEHQWACRQGTSVVHAIADWLAETADDDAGAEMDLSKAYDNVDHQVASIAFEFQAVPAALSAVCHMAWLGPRTCCVDGEMAAPLWPKKALAQGDSCAPGGMTASLVPWTVPSPTKKWKFMDDRSLSSRGPDAAQQVDQAIAVTQLFDSSIGFVENADKRQHWKRGEHTKIEHLGIVCVPWDPTTPIQPRSGWSKLENAIVVLASLPGSMAVREGLAACYIRPIWN